MLRRSICLTIILLCVVTLTYAKEFTTMELLINKDWYELDMQNMQARNNFYYRFTGTQRLTIGSDQDGNMKMKIQEYYLSNKYEKYFDPTKVGKYRTGKFIVIGRSSKSKASNAICLKIKDITESGLQLVDENISKEFVKYYFTDEKETKKGEIISTRKLLTERKWYQLDEITGKRQAVEQTFNNWYVLKCVMAENRRKEFPKWKLWEYYLSDTIVTEFDRDKVGTRENGIYLVINEQDEDGEWQAVNYDISTLSDTRLVLNCVYPQGIAPQIYENSLGKVGHDEAKLKPMQNQLMANEWYLLDTVSWNRSKITFSYNKTHVTRSYTVRKDGMLKNESQTFEYYMSNTPVEEFDWRQKGRNLEGDYIVVNESDRKGGWRTVNYRIELMSDKNLVLRNETTRDSSLIIFERDLSKEEIAYNEELVAESKRVKTMKDKLVGKQWRPLYNHQEWYENRKWKLNTSYYTESKIGGPTSKEKVGDMVIDYKVWIYYLADEIDWEFDENKLGLNLENGKYLNYCGFDYRNDFISGTWEILYLSENLLVVNQGVKENVVRKVSFLSE